MTFKVIYLLQAFSYGVFRSCAAVDKISTDSASRGPSAIAEFLVMLGLYDDGHRLRCQTVLRPVFMFYSDCLQRSTAVVYVKTRSQ